METPRLSTDYIVVHCSWTPPKMKANAADIDRWHREKGYFKIGYHFVITRDGDVEVGRKIASVGAHVLVRGQAYNQRSVGICLIGGRRETDGDANDPSLQDDNYTAAQWEALRSLVLSLKQKYPTAQVVGHRDLTNDGRACPSFDVAEWVERNYTNVERPHTDQGTPGACIAEPEGDVPVRTQRSTKAGGTGKGKRGK